MTTERRVTYPNPSYSGYTRSLSERGGGRDCEDCGGHGGCPECRAREASLAEAPKRIAGQRQFTSGGATVADVLDELGMDPDSINQLEASCKLALPHLRASLAARQPAINHFPEVKE